MQISPGTLIVLCDDNGAAPRRLQHCPQPSMSGCSDDANRTIAPGNVVIACSIGSKSAHWPMMRQSSSMASNLAVPARNIACESARIILFILCASSTVAFCHTPLWPRDGGKARIGLQLTVINLRYWLIGSNVGSPSSTPAGSDLHGVSSRSALAKRIERVSAVPPLSLSCASETL